VLGDDGELNLVFLGSERPFVSHDACMGLYRWDETNQVAENVIPVVESPSAQGASVSGLGFPGLFLGQLPMNCNIGNNYMVTNTLWGSFQRIIRIDIKNGKSQLIDIPQLNKLASHSICTVGPNGDLVVSETSCDKPASLWMVRNEDLVQETKEGSDKIVADAQRVASFSPIATSTFSAVIRDAEVPYSMQVLSIDSDSVDGAESYPIQALLLLPKTADEEGKIPMIVVPHGGPHSCSASAFSPGIAYLATKYAVLLPNYRGSIGFGQAPLNSLLTRIGRVDVEDVMLFTKHVIRNFSVVDDQRVGICGGSHGGFLTAHCTSQYPEFFKAGKKIFIVSMLFDRHVLSKVNRN
jgi:acylaminoacyl-peptidase